MPLHFTQQIPLDTCSLLWSSSRKKRGEYMSVGVAEEPRVLHTIPGRVRVHLPGWSGQGKQSLEMCLRQIQGVSSTQANPVTGNILIQFDPLVTNEQTILKAVYMLDLDNINTQKEEAAPGRAMRETHGPIVRARIAVRGMDRDPHLAKQAVELLERHPGVRASANLLTGRVLVEFAEHEADLDDLIAEVFRIELPELPGEDRPDYPLDPGPLIQSATRTIGAALGLGLLAGRRLFSLQEPLPGSGTALQVASITGILQGIAPIRYGLRRLLGRTGADLLVHIPAIITLTLADSPLGLALIGGEALRLLTEVLARRSAWQRHEERVANAPPAQPDALIRLETGERTPLAAKVIKGTGTAIGRDGMPAPVVEGGAIPPGARLYGGPFVLKLKSEESFQAFMPEPRSAPITPSLFDRYHQLIGALSFANAGITALLTRSLNRTLAALLLVNPRTALIGLDSADLSTSARGIRAGVTPVGTRINRTINLTALLLLDSTRLLTDKLALHSALSLTIDYDTTGILAHAAELADAAGLPWGGIVRHSTNIPATDGTFDGKTASAQIQGVNYSLGPVEDWSSIPEAARLRQRGNYVLVLRSEHEEKS